jgi:hypothetical protein
MWVRSLVVFLFLTFEWRKLLLCGRISCFVVVAVAAAVAAEILRTRF